MYEKITFRRNPLNGILMAICIVVFVLSGLLHLATGSPLGFMFLILAIFYLINVIWMFSTPFAVIENDSLTVSAGMMNKKIVQLAEIRSISRASTNRIDVSLSNGGNISLRLFGMVGEDKDKLAQTLEGFVP